MDLRVMAYLCVLRMDLKLPIGTQGLSSPTIRSELPQKAMCLTGGHLRLGETKAPSHQPASMSLYSWSMKASSCSRS